MGITDDPRRGIYDPPRTEEGRIRERFGSPAARVREADTTASSVLSKLDRKIVIRGSFPATITIPFSLKRESERRENLIANGWCEEPVRSY